MSAIAVQPNEVRQSDRGGSSWNEEKCRTATKMTGRQRFLNALSCRPVDHPPVWLMRQAGRALPEYRALKGNHSFLKLVQTPELAAEVTLQPIRRYDFDAAILFSDILVVAEALGQRYHFRDQGGIEMEFVLRSSDDIERLDPGAVTGRLQYVAQAIPLIRSALAGRTALLGFAGSPWTLANFMLEGGSAREYTKAKTLFYSDRRLFNRLFDKLTSAIADFLQLQIDAGVDAIQIFDSLGGELAANAYPDGSARWVAQVIARLRRPVPVILFAKGVHDNWGALQCTGARAFSVDRTARLDRLRARLPLDVALQGNLDPMLMTTTSEIVRAEARRILERMALERGFIFNLGHGLPPASKLECMEALVSTVRSFQ